MHKSQVLFYILAGFLAGIFVASILSISDTVVYTGIIVAIGIIAVFGYHKSFNGKLLFVGLVGIAFFVGVMRFNVANLGQDRLETFADRKAGDKNVDVILNGYIDDEPHSDSNGQKIVLKAKELIAGGRKISIDDKVLIISSSFPKFNYGDKVSLRGALQKPVNFSDFDYVTYLKKQNIRTISPYPDIEPHSDLKLGMAENLKISIYRSIFKVKRSFELAIAKSIHEPNASFISGILLGSRQNIPDDLKEAFNKTGTTHILAISGYNIMIISWAVLALLVYFFKRRNAFWLSVLVISIFTVITGASASVIRAAIMGLLLLFANGYGRLYNPKNSIILAGAAMVWFNPLSLVFDIGFQLSFAAVLGLMYLYPYLDSKLRKIPEAGKFKENFLMTISAQISVAPLLIYYFKSISLTSLPANILIVPFLPAAMFLGFVSGFIGMIFAPFGHLASVGFWASQVPGWLVWALTTYQIGVVKVLAIL